MKTFLLGLSTVVLAAAVYSVCIYDYQFEVAGRAPGGLIAWEENLYPAAKTAAGEEVTEGGVDTNGLVDATTLVWQALFGSFIPSSNPESSYLVGGDSSVGRRFSQEATGASYQGEPRQIREELHFWVKTDRSGKYGKFAQRSFLMGRDGVERQLQMIHGDWEIGAQCQDYIESAILLNAVKLNARGFFAYNVDESVPPIVDEANEFEVDNQEVVKFYNPANMAKLFVVYVECGNTLVIRSRRLPDGTSPEVRVMENSFYFSGANCTSSPNDSPEIIAAYLVKGQEVTYDEFVAHQQLVDKQIKEHGHYYGDYVNHYHDHATEHHHHGEEDKGDDHAESHSAGLTPGPHYHSAGVISDLGHPTHVHNKDGTHTHIITAPEVTAVQHMSWGALKGYFGP